MDQTTTEIPSVTTSFQNSFNATRSPVKCEPKVNEVSAILSFIPAIQVIINLIFVIAVFKYRSKLRNNFVYAYVISLLMANVMFGIFSILSMVNRGLGLEVVWTPDPTHRVDHSNPSHQHMLRWWVLRSSFVICLYLTMSANVSVLIYGIRESTYFVGPGVARKRLSSDASESVNSKHCKAAILISSCWVFPFLLSLACVAGWSCADKCQCFSGYYTDIDLCQTKTFHQTCSTLQLPLSQQFVSTAVIMWFVLSLFIVVMLVATIKKYNEITRPNRNMNPLKHVINEHQEASVENFTDENHDDDVTSLRNTTSDIQSSRSYSRFRKFWSFQNYNVTIKLMLYISILFVVCSAPSVIVLIMDVANRGNVLRTDAVLGSYAVSMAYCIISPFVLCYHMAGLRAAVVSLFTTKCCSQTVVHRGTRNS